MNSLGQICCVQFHIDLRTPLTSISGNADFLLSNSAKIDDVKRQELYNNIYDDSMWLINLVENIFIYYAYRK